MENKTNIVNVTGKIVSAPVFNREMYGKKFYMVYLEAGRLSGQKDLLPLMVSERLLDMRENYIGCTVEIQGQFRSYNRKEGKRSRLILSVFVQEICFVKEKPDFSRNNEIFLDGYVCKAPIYRKTPLGREIADILLAVNRPYGKADYIPCIAWGRNAQDVADFKVGKHICIWGRIQSREYTKKLSEELSETRTAYEVSISRMEVEER